VSTSLWEEAARNLQAEVERLRAENEALRRDALLLRAGLEKALPSIVEALRIGDRRTDAWTAAWLGVDTLNAAIDAAMQGSKT